MVLADSWRAVRFLTLFLGVALVAPGQGAPSVPDTKRVWEMVEITVHAQGTYRNPYKDVKVWVDLQGPGFSKRCYGFWDGKNIFRVRVVATAPGKWSWTSGSNPPDAGLNGKIGSFAAVAWTEAEKQQNPCRRGFIQPTSNGHALQYADGTPFFLLGDTWWPVPTFRYRWFDDETSMSRTGWQPVSSPRPGTNKTSLPPADSPSKTMTADQPVPHIGPGMGLKDAVRFRKAQGFNCIAMIAAFPHWANDGKPASIVAPDGTAIRDAWGQAGTKSAKDMRDEDGNRPFLFPGNVPGFEDMVPDLNRINPDYFKNMDKKIAYLNSQGFVPFIEPARRDIGQVWKKYYDWPESYERYIQYVWSRYQANNCIFSPIHFDWNARTIPPDDWNVPANKLMDDYGHPPFGTLVTLNSPGSSLRAFGHVDKARWITMHQAGNQREHKYYTYLTEMFNTSPVIPCLNGEPYYDGFQKKHALGGTELSALYVRSGMYGSVLSGGLAGHIHGAQGLWAGDIEDAAESKIWDALPWSAGAQMPYLPKFVMSEGAKYQNLVPSQELVTPNQSGPEDGFTGWAYCACTNEKDFFLLYFEKECPKATLSGAISNASYRAHWFNPRTGEWSDAGSGTLTTDASGKIVLPDFPDNSPTSTHDWAMKLLATRGSR